MGGSGLAFTFKWHVKLRSVAAAAAYHTSSTLSCLVLPSIPYLIPCSAHLPFTTLSLPGNSTVTSSTLLYLLCPALPTHLPILSPPQPYTLHCPALPCPALACMLCPILQCVQSNENRPCPINTCSYTINTRSSIRTGSHLFANWFSTLKRSHITVRLYSIQLRGSPMESVACENFGLLLLLPPCHDREQKKCLSVRAIGICCCAAQFGGSSRSPPYRLHR